MPRFSPYEQRSVSEALTRLGASLEFEPDGKRVEAVMITTLDVVEPRDPIPDVLALPRILNALHITTKRYVVRRETLLAVGDVYEHSLAEETCRNLRTLPQLSLALCFPVTGSTPGSVRFVVITKDVWSLRLNSDLSFGSGGLERLVLQPSETNLFGSHQSLSALFRLDPAAYALGARYAIPRVWGSRVLALADASVIVGRESGEVEGSEGTLSYGQPLYSMEAKWGWLGTFQWRSDINRRFIAGKIARFESPRGPTAIPYEYHEDIIKASYAVTRSFGVRYKHDVTVGLSASRRAFRAFDLSSYAPEDQRDFLATVVPVSDTKLGPYVQYRTYSAGFMRVLDFNTLGLQEDYRVGHDVILRAAPSSRELLSSRDVLSLYAAAAYTWQLGDGLARAFLESKTDLEPDRISDASLTFGGRIASPTTPIGRLMFDARVVDRYRNYLREYSVLGGEGRLRGYPTGAFIGKNQVVGNLEYRSPSANVLGVQLGGAAFFDAGDAFDAWDDLHPKQGAGVGLRVLIPMLDRVVLRADWGFPLSDYRPARPRGGFPGEIIVTFRQAFSQPTIPSVDDGSVAEQ